MAEHSQPEENHDRTGDPNSANGAIDISESQTDRDRAIQFHQQSIEIARNIGDRHEEAVSLNKLSQVYREIPDYPQAIECDRAAIEIWQTLNNSEEEAKTWQNLATAYYQTQQSSQIVRCYDRLIQIYRATNQKQKEAQAAIALGRLCQEMGKFREGMALINAGNQILDDIGAPLDAWQIPPWAKSTIQFARRGWFQFGLCCLAGAIAFPFALVGFLALFLWRFVRASMRRF
ncbi:MAG: tetratricopeptide repeat protein [Cyanobacteriota bacterium]|nr:tetratricopeptide repeat protein [Cyanobacteriota bacterium]